MLWSRRLLNQSTHFIVPNVAGEPFLHVLAQRIAAHQLRNLRTLAACCAFHCAARDLLSASGRRVAAQLT
ncbi:hypothetical protein YT1_p20059 (plasmid) [Rhodococcus ruber]|nr:hypothetical protein YT1_p20059 [Rhodococcus ruber]